MVLLVGVLICLRSCSTYGICFFVLCKFPALFLYLLSLPMGRQQPLLESQEQKCTAKMEFQEVHNS